MDSKALTTKKDGLKKKIEKLEIERKEMKE